MADKLHGGTTPAARAMGDTPRAGRACFVAGATGYTGQALVTELRRRRVDVVAHIRPDSAQLGQWEQRFAAEGARISTAPWDDDAMTAALAEVRPAAVFALLGTTRARMRTSARGAATSYEAVDYGLSALLLRATRRAAPDAHFIYLSSIGVGPRARGAYLQVRWRMEQELRASGIQHTIVRPAFISGPDRSERRPLERVGASLTSGVLRIAGALGGRELRDRYRTRSAADLAEELADIVEPRSHRS
jgi:uncharacterized protein YbjT (DUF2867 family)